MATIEEALANGHLDIFELPESEERLPQRPLYVTDEFMTWADTTAVLHDESKTVGGRTLFEHLLIALCEFRCGKRPAGCGDLRRMMPTKDGVWSFHTIGLRVYGWVPAAHHFVAVTAALEKDTKADKMLNATKRKAVIQFAQDHALENTIKHGDILALFPN
jgi:hypothetical protein